MGFLLHKSKNIWQSLPAHKKFYFLGSHPKSNFGCMWVWQNLFSIKKNQNFPLKLFGKIDSSEWCIRFISLAVISTWSLAVHLLVGPRLEIPAVKHFLESGPRNIAIIILFIYSPSFISKTYFIVLVEINAAGARLQDSSSTSFPFEAIFWLWRFFKNWISLNMLKCFLCVFIASDSECQGQIVHQRAPRGHLKHFASLALMKVAFGMTLT